MPPIELGPSRPVGAVDVRLARSAGGNAERSGPAVRAEAPGVVRSTSLDAGAPPVDGERVAVIRKAIEQGNYPVIPTRVADAIIAAGILLRTGTQ